MTLQAASPVKSFKLAWLAGEDKGYTYQGTYYLQGDTVLLYYWAKVAVYSTQGGLPLDGRMG
jgi:hypothetical protein